MATVLEDGNRGTKRTQDEISEENGDFNPLGEQSVDAFMTQRLSVKRRNMMTQLGPSDSDENSEDSSELESESDEDEDGYNDEDEEVDDSPARAGVIERISLKNFMCHDSFELKLGPQINFIIGRNGSGKSAVLTGISVGLGAKATDTNRGSSIKELIKDGKSTARVSIVFLNDGPDAYKPEDYGKRIIIERKIQRVGANSYSIKSEVGKTVSTKKSTLDEILYKFSITIDNPLAFLSQDKAREFLTSTTDRMKYDLFMSGAFITDILDNYTRTTKNIVEVQKKVRQAKEHLAACSQKYREVATVYNRHKQSDYLRHKLGVLHGKVYWYNVHNIEAKIQKYQDEVEHCQKEIERINEESSKCDSAIEKSMPKREQLANRQEEIERKVDASKVRYETAKQKREDIRNTLVQTDEEIAKNIRDVEQTKTTIENNRKLIEEEQKRIDEINGGSKEALRTFREELEQEAVGLEEQRREIRSTLDNLETRDNPEIVNVQKDIKNSDNRIRALKQNRAGIQASQRDQYAAWGNNINNVIHKIRETTGWHKEPIGPLGVSVEVKPEYSEWKPLLNAVLNKTLDSFLVCDEHDRRILEGILKKNNVRKNILVRKFEHFNYRSGMPVGHTTFLDMINCTNEEVLHTLIDLGNIEKFIISDKNKGHLLIGEKNVMSVFSLFSRISGSRLSSNNGTIRRDPVYFSDDIVKFSSGSMANDLIDIDKEIDDEITNNNLLKRRLREITMKDQNNKMNLEKDLKRLNDQLNKTKKQIFETENRLNEDGDMSKIVTLNTQIAEYEDQIKRYEGIIQSLTDEVTAKKEEYDELKQITKKLRLELGHFQEEKANAMEELVKFDTEVATLKDNKEQLDFEKSQKDLQKDKASSKIEEGTARLKPLIETAEKICPRDEVTITADDTQDSIASEYAEVQHQIKEAEKEIGRSFEEIQLELIEARDKRNDANQNLDALDETYRQLDSDLNVRFNFLHTTILSSVQQASRTFENALGLRGFKGSLDFDFGKRTLTLLAQTKSDDEKRTVDSLSGGEKSFSQIALLLSIWKVMDSRIRGLDEFDVYMDSVNRSISIKLLLSELRQYPKSQNIFITPQDIAVVGDLNSRDVKIHKMSDPRSDN
ncbi:P-loop containing nucleoside triphosphate hydrolase protein [Scheffersomyces xylosifermentans]|uniref:P-loop containing nucleoside triphosphate hydrolase protein n=1 Tax=Scheffersomyces xylosifermentans TaxID=1304137 RepID=UPI00315E00C6